jgi:hypothetical protein
MGLLITKSCHEVTGLSFKKVVVSLAESSLPFSGLLPPIVADDGATFGLGSTEA